MTAHFGDFDTTETVYIPFNTFDSNDPSASVTATTLLNTDCHVHKDGAVAQRTSSAGETLSLNFDSVTGNHLLALDLSDDTHAGFYAAGSTYQVRIEGATVDGANINAWIGSFSIGRMLRPTTAGRTLDVLSTGEAGIDLDNTKGTLDAAQIGADAITAAKVAADVHAEAADAVWDEVLTGATHNVTNSSGRRLRQIQEAGGYSGGAIYIDTVNGNDGSTDYEDGVDSKPCKTMGNANTLAASLGLSTFVIASGSSITFAAAQQNQTFKGQNWTLALGGQDIVGSVVMGANVSGIAAGTGTTQRYIDCILGATSHIKGTHMLMCGMSGTQTVAEAGDFFLDQCHSGIAGTSTWIWEFGDAIGNTNLNVRNYSGGIQLESMGDTGTDTASIEGQGNIIEGTCTGGTVAVRGLFTTSGIANLTLSDDARIDVAQVGDAVWDEDATGHQTGGTFGQAIGDPGANTETMYDAVVTDAAGTNVAADIIVIDTVVDAIKVITDALGSAGAANLALSAAGIIGGAAEAGTLSTTVMTSDLTGYVNDELIGRTIIWTGGDANGQASDITDYASASGTVTYTAITTLPAAGDTFVIV